MLWTRWAGEMTSRHCKAPARRYGVWLILAAVLLLYLARLAPALEQLVLNPYHHTAVWKLWTTDDRPIRLADGRTVRPTPLHQRLYPDDPPLYAGPDRFLAYRRNDWPDRRYAGFWDDVYSSQDGGHSYVRSGWSDQQGNSVTIKNGIIHVQGGNPLNMGANFTSRSTTGMGHDLTNRKTRLTWIEKNRYFANILTAGPAHISFMDRNLSGSDDQYQALSPILYNSMGSSGSETMAITKMIIAGGYLPRETKPLIKRHGLYPSALLYLWKAALPYQVPYDHELRHRVAYNSTGDHSDYTGINQTEVNLYYHNYDETAHMRNMVRLAKSLSHAPPIALLNTMAVEGGRTVYALKSTLLVHQDRYQNVKIRVSAADSYDLQDRPLSFRWKVIYGNKNTTIEPEGDTATYRITVPYDGRLPKGRTTILLIANNGQSDSNPAVINVFRTYGAPNLRPKITGLENRTILPGETVRFELQGMDPEGFPVSFYQWAGEVGVIDGSSFEWTCPPDQADGQEPVTIIASDGCAGNSYNSRRAIINVRSTVAALNAAPSRGPAPLTVQFRSAGSRDKKSGPLKFFWDFDDGATSQAANPVHTFDRPGYYQVALIVKGPSGSHERRTVIHVEHQWPMILCNGWDSNQVDQTAWQPIPADMPLIIEKHTLRLHSRSVQMPGRLDSVQNYHPPLYLEAVYRRWRDASQPPSGFQILGAQIGFPAVPYSSRNDITLACPPGNAGRNFSQVVIGPKFRLPWCWTRLRLYVDRDPRHSGKISYRGYLVNGQGSHFFRLDDQAVLDSRLAILSGQLRARFDVQRFQVWSSNRPTGPKSSASSFPCPSDRATSCPDEPDDFLDRLARPSDRVSLQKIHVQGNGLNIHSGSDRPNLSDHTDFGPAPTHGPGVTRTFTLQNLDFRPMTLGETPLCMARQDQKAEDFHIVKPPRTHINGHGAATFKIMFQPREKGLHRARIRLKYGPGENTVYEFAICGRGV